MRDASRDQFAQMETTCGSLLSELQVIWDEVGEGDVERDKMLLEIEEECLEVYRRKVDEAKKFRSELNEGIAAAEAEIDAICSLLGEQSQKEKRDGVNLKEELEAVVPRLEKMRKRRSERRELFVEVLDRLRDVTIEIFGSTKDDLYKVVVDETNLSMNKLEELRTRLQDLENEKSNRLKQVMDLISTVKSLCGVLGMDFKHMIHKIHPTLDGSEGPKDVTDDTIKRLTTVIQSLREVKIKRMQRLQDLGTSLLELWTLMDTPMEEQQMFHTVTANIAASESEITKPDTLSVDLIKLVEAEVSRLEQLKSSKVIELVLKKRMVLEEICKNTHIVTETLTATRYSIEVLESGAVDPLHLLQEIELEIEKISEEASSRKDILDKVDKWLAVCNEECWLEEYSRDENRYNAGRGAHLALKRAEKARILVNKAPAMVEALSLKITSWEKERGTEFFYDGERLLSMLEQYSIIRQEKEQERQRQRDQKRLQVLLITEQEALFGSKPSPLHSGKKASRISTGVASNRKVSLGGAMLQNLRSEKAAPKVQYGGIGNQFRRSSEVAGNLVKKPSSNAKKASETTSKLVRKPLSPIPLTVSSSQTNISNSLEVEKRNEDPRMILTCGDEKQTTLPCSKTPGGTPPKPIFVGDEENRVKIATKARETKSHLIRKPLSPIPLTMSSQTNISNAPEDERRNGELRTMLSCGDEKQTTLPCSKTPVRTPPKSVFIGAGNNMIEKTMLIPVLSTPPTVSAPMLMALTPATPFVTSGARTVRTIMNQIEYSFEELRAGFLPK